MSEKYIATNICYFGCQLVETFVVQLRFTFGPNAPLPRDRCAPFLGGDAFDYQYQSSTSFGWGKGGNVTSAGWQVTLCDPMWHVSSRSGVATLQHLLLTYLLDCLCPRGAANPSSFISHWYNRFCHGRRGWTRRAQSAEGSSTAAQL